jgi:hypothetical protein
MSELNCGGERIQASDRLEVLLVEGLHGEESELTGASWADLRKEALEQLKLRHKSRSR